jgi:hypothetical protein
MKDVLLNVVTSAINKAEEWLIDEAINHSATQSIDEIRVINNDTSELLYVNGRLCTLFNDI